MTQPIIRTTFTASLTDPDDPAEVTLLAEPVSVGRTRKLASGEIVRWTAEFLREKAASFVGQPLNVDLDEDGEPTGHSRRIVGAVVKAWFDEQKQVIAVHAALWPHYSSTVARLKELGSRLSCSMEFLPTADLRDNGDGSVSPTEGRFSGLAIVKAGADLRNRVILVAAAQSEAEQIVDAALDRVFARYAQSHVDAIATRAIKNAGFEQQ